MNTSLYYIVFYGGASIISALIIFIFKSVIADIKGLQEEMKTKVSEKEVRQIVSDKLDPIQNNLEAIQAKVDKIIDIMINK